MAKKMTDEALKVVKAYEASLGMDMKDFEHIPLHYSIADLVSGLMLLAKREGLDFAEILKDARGVVADAKKGLRVMDGNSLLCAVHGTPVSPKESEPCKHCVAEFSTSKSSR
jgi:hypothetical protein